MKIRSRLKLEGGESLPATLHLLLAPTPAQLQGGEPPMQIGLS